MEYNDLSKPASAATRQIHQAMKTLLDFDDPHEKECALRNCLKKVENLDINPISSDILNPQTISSLPPAYSFIINNVNMGRTGQPNGTILCPIETSTENSV